MTDQHIPSSEELSATTDDDDAFLDEADDPALDRLRADVSDALERRIHEVERDAWAAIAREVPAYRALARDPSTADEIQASVGSVVQVFIQLVRKARPFSDDEFALMRQVGMRRAEQGLTAEDLQQAAHTALKIGLRHLRSEMKALGINERVFDAAGEIADSLNDYVHQFARAAAAGVRGVEERRAGARADERAEVAAQLLDGTLTDPDAIRQATAAIGHPLDAPCTLLVFTASEADARPQLLAGPISALLQDHEALLRGPVRSTPIPHVAAVAPLASNASAGQLVRRIKDFALRGKLVVVAERIVDLTELSPTYQWISDLLRTPVEHRAHGIVEIDDLLPHWLVGRLPHDFAFLFAKRIAGPLLASDVTTRERILPTVRSYFEANGSIKETAEVLGIDRRTVERHLADFETLTGRSLRAPDHQLLVQHVLHLLSLRGTLPAPGDARWRDEGSA